MRLEKLDGYVRKQLQEKPSKHLAQLVILSTQIGYKTRLLGIPVEYIDPHYASQICSKCRHIRQREGKNFKCLDCGHVDHADVNAS
ncbi:MAG: zinc ribbon domain-containing protein [Candidatus Nitrosopolaris sp.]